MPSATQSEVRNEKTGFAWKEGSPESVGISSQGLAEIEQSLAAHGGGLPLLVARHDTIVHERYRDGQSADNRVGNASCAKTMVVGTALLVAVQNNRVSLDQRASIFVPEWRDDPVRGKITIRQLASMSAGLDDGSPPGDWKEGRDWNHRFWAGLCQKRLDEGGYEPPYPNPFDISRTETPIIFDPGTSWAYSNPGIAMLGEVISRAYLKAGQPVRTRDLIDRAVYSKIGLKFGEDWDLWYDRNPFEAPDGALIDGGWGGMGITMRAQATWARLMLRRGDWDGQRVIKPQLVDVFTDSRANPAGDKQSDYGLTFWLHAGGAMASGAGASIAYFQRELDLIVVYQGGNKLDEEMKDHTRRAIDGVIASITDGG